MSVFQIVKLTLGLGAMLTTIGSIIAATKPTSPGSLRKRGLRKSLDGVKDRLLAEEKEMDGYKNDKKEKEMKKERLCNEIITTKEELKRQKILFENQVIDRGFKHIIMVMIGKTSHGKSTLGNRIYGDVSNKGNQGPFGVNSKKYEAGTKEVTSAKAFQNMKGNKSSCLLIVDTPGWGDVDETSDDNDTNSVTRYLEGCTGINSFLMVLSNRDKIDGSIQQMLSEYEKLFGDKFWKHLTIIMTGIDDEDDLRDFEKETHVADIQKLLKEKFIHLQSLNLDVPVIPIGKKTYKKQIPLIMERISKKKLTCKALKGPYELLEEKYEELKADLTIVDHELVKLKENISSKSQEIEELKKQRKQFEEELNKE